MTSVLQLVLVCVKHNILFRAKYMAGFRNTLAHALSRFQNQRFKTAFTGIHGSDGNKSSTPSSSTQLASMVHELLSDSLKSSSVPTYRRALKRFKEFQLGVFHSQNASLPIAPATLALFVAYLFANHYAISTVNTYVSAIGYYHRLASLKDPTKTFYIIEMLKGYGRINHTLDSRIPITLPTLIRIKMQVSGSVCASQYQSCMFKAMCSLALFDFLRIGEITVTKPQSIHSNLLYLAHVTRQFCSKGKVVPLVVTVTNYEHNTNRNAFSLILQRQLNACPIQSFLDYITVRGLEKGPLFINIYGWVSCFEKRLRESPLLCYSTMWLGSLQV